MHTVGSDTIFGETGGFDTYPRKTLDIRSQIGHGSMTQQLCSKKLNESHKWFVKRSGSLRKSQVTEHPPSRRIQENTLEVGRKDPEESEDKDSRKVEERDVRGPPSPNAGGRDLSDPETGQ